MPLLPLVPREGAEECPEVGISVVVGGGDDDDGKKKRKEEISMDLIELSRSCPISIVCLFLLGPLCFVQFLALHPKSFSIAK